MTKYLILSKNNAFLVDTEGKLHIQSLDYSEANEDIDNLLHYTLEFAAKSKIGILLSDDLVYVFSSKMKFLDESGNTVDEKILVENKIKSKIPEEISDVVWDYKAKQLDTENKLFQIAVTNPSTTKIISKLFESDINVDFVEPISYALARNIELGNQIYMIVSSSIFENCILISENRYIHLAISFDRDNFQNEFLLALEYAAHHYVLGEEKIKIYASEESVKELNLQIPDVFKNKCDLLIRPINIFTKELIDEKKHHGKDEEILSILPKIATPHTKLMIDFSFFKSNRRKLIGFIAVALIIFIGFGVFSFLRDDRLTEEQVTPNDVPASVDLQDSVLVADVIETFPEETLSTEPANYRILVLNGSGVAGEASRVGQTLVNEGFKTPDVGNYPEGTIAQTTVKTKSSMSAEALEKVTEILSEYDVTYSSELLDDSSPYDIEIVIGENRL